MNSIPSSKGTALLVTLLIAMAAVGTAAAVTTSETTAPEEAQVDEEVTVEVTITELYEPDDDWTLRGTTQLDNVTSWQVTQTSLNGTTVEPDENYAGQSEFELDVSSGDSFRSITISVTGDAPDIDDFSYNSPQTFDGMKLTKALGGGESDIETVEIHHYTEDSREARNAIESAEAAVNGTDSADAESDLQNAIDWYNEGEFDRAISNAESAEQAANNAQGSNDTPVLLYGIGAIVVLVLIGGGVYYYRSQQQDSYDKLR
ncbi:putative membrane protein [Halapricum desulfuricans]|uniref:Putative membrane protein n=2 Tax=Halapricum desulfuricans TaxID=2841257 RepID=A0A897NMZ0_9EURY|nr:putative membrane protein [Halapricum desulfuricans]